MRIVFQVGIRLTVLLASTLVVLADDIPILDVKSPPPGGPLAEKGGLGWGGRGARPGPDAEPIGPPMHRQEPAHACLPGGHPSTPEQK
jgi:hypothetical protein